MNTMPKLALLLAATLSVTPALAQVGGGIGGGAGGGIGGNSSSSVGSGSTSSGGGIDLGGGSGSSISGGAGALGSGAAGVGAGTTEERASEGSQTINSLNVDSIARGNVGAASGLGAGTTNAGGQPASIAGSGSAELYNIPQPRVEVDLSAIRNALSAGPSATPKADGR